MAKVFIEETTLSAIGDAIRTKTETTELINPTDMAEKIEGISVGSAAVVEPLSITSNGTYRAPEGIDGYTPVIVNVPQEGGPTAAELLIKGNCQYRFANNSWNWIINKYGNQIIADDVEYFDYMFHMSSDLENIPFDINNVDISGSNKRSLENMFYYCSKLKRVPEIYGTLQVDKAKNMFYQCENLRSIPDSYGESLDWSYITSLTSATGGDKGGMFSRCYSLRHIPSNLIKYVNPVGRYYYSPYSGTFYNCYVLDEIVDLGVVAQGDWTSGGFGSAFSSCNRLKRLTFAVNEDGTPITAQWSNQTIDLLSGIGYSTDTTGNCILKHNSGLTRDTQITDDATYQALKDNPDNWTMNMSYSRYNKISAIETIATLPDTSAYIAQKGGTNTIKFKGAAGALTDGGAINTMTEEEIAVATAKGWTVSFG